MNLFIIIIIISGCSVHVWADEYFLTVIYFAFAPPFAGSPSPPKNVLRGAPLQQDGGPAFHARSFTTVRQSVSPVSQDLCRAAPFNAVLSGSSATLPLPTESLMVPRCQRIFFCPLDNFFIS